MSLAVALAMHFLVAASYGWLSPKGFPIAHSRFWLNSILPLVTMTVAAIGMVGLLSDRRRLAGLVALLFATGWLGGAIAGRVLFPLGLRGFWGLGVVIALCGFGFAWSLIRPRFQGTGRFFFAGLFSLFVGVFVVWAQIPPSGLSQPLDLVVPKPSKVPRTIDASTLELVDEIRYYPSAAELVLQRAEVVFRCSPLLRFDRVSPDGFWSLLAPRGKQPPSLSSATIDDSGEYCFRYGSSASVQLSKSNSAGRIQCTAWNVLEQETYSHLNSFCTLVVEGHQNLSLGFSPCPSTLIEVLSADYPTGRPARFAYLTEQQEFEVVEATSGEKGPFRKLASGRLLQGEPLSITFFENEQLLATLTLDDWTQQLGTALSPTAGWRVPMNAIEFRRSGDSKTSRVEIFITLAATSVGRGWETVGHRAGTYRNRISFQLEPLPGTP